MSSEVAPSAEDAPRNENLSQQSFSPPKRVIVATIVTGVVFSLVLEFIVVISFLGQRLWKDPRFFSDFRFTLPFLIWLIVVVVVALLLVRVATTWLHVSKDGFTVNGLLRRKLTCPWDQVGSMVAIHDIERGPSVEALDEDDASFDGVYAVDNDGSRIFAASNRLFDRRAQRALLQYARKADVEVRVIDEVSGKKMRRETPGLLGFGDRHPSLLLLAVVAFYLAHNVLTLVIWGL